MIDLLAALQLPDASRLEKRIAKTVLTEHGAVTAADKRAIADGIEELTWVAALKPINCGIAEYRDAQREYLEVAVLRCQLRASAKASRLAELIHRAVPYPVVLITLQGAQQTLSLAHKRWAHNEAGKWVLDGELVQAQFSTQPPAASAVEQSFAEALALHRQTGGDFLALMQSYIDTVSALQLARLSGVWAQPKNVEDAGAMRERLRRSEELAFQISQLRQQLAKATQMQKRVELNLALQQLNKEKLQVETD
ncbi:MAG: DUF4391 domain-containing protein [Stagnimonas sp.]|nr:DUF4391 domain-containing protein [Stagnimonas sp.]